LQLKRLLSILLQNRLTREVLKRLLNLHRKLLRKFRKPRQQLLPKRHQRLRAVAAAQESESAPT